MADSLPTSFSDGLGSLFGGVNIQTHNSGSFFTKPDGC
jgi:hypothetical protein